MLLSKYPCLNCLYLYTIIRNIHIISKIILEALSPDYYNNISMMNNKRLNDLERNLRKVEYFKSMKLKQKSQFRENNTNFWE